MPWKSTGLWDAADTTLCESRLTNGGEVVSLTHRPRSTPQKNVFISESGTRFFSRLSNLQGLARL
jgi:hypothetical protein